MLDFDPMREAVAPRDAATVLLLRERDDSLEVFLVRRNADVRFMGGAYVFPGGKLDAGDCQSSWEARVHGLDARAAAERLDEPDNLERALGLHVAACRETLEEAGVLLAHGADASTAERARARLSQGASFVEVVAELGLPLSLDALVPLSRWITPRAEARRFDARFFLARFPDEQRASHDDGETVDAAWMTPAVALEREATGEIQLPPPTIATLAWLAPHRTIAAAFGAAGKPPRIDPEFVKDLDEWVLALPGDRAHPRSERVLDGATRFELRDGRWIAR